MLVLMRDLRTLISPSFVMGLPATEFMLNLEAQLARVVATLLVSVHVRCDISFVIV